MRTRTVVAPKRPCPRCGALNHGPCLRCERARDRARGFAHARGYTKQWSPYAQAWLARYPLCGQRQDGRLYADHSHCVRDGYRVRADVVDHIVPLRDGGALLDPRNHQSLCYACNNRKR